MFINDLFSGNLRQYTEFIQKLNDAESLEGANQILSRTKRRKTLDSKLIALYNTSRNYDKKVSLLIQS